nr:diacylglycerol lipase-alpha-like [Lytechinus pictus]
MPIVNVVLGVVIPWRRTRAKYEQNWDKRLRFWFCCTSSGETQDSAFSDIAILFSEFFRDLDVVPTDVLAGLMLLREEQKQRRRAIENSPQNSVFKFLSGVAVTPETKFLDFHKTEDMDLFEELHYYFKFAAASYGWKGYVMVYGAEGCCTMTRECRCCCFKRRRHYHLDETSDPDADNCCMCNFAALKKMSGLSNNDIIYATFHVSVSSNKEESSVAESYGLDTEGLVLVGRTNEKGGLKRDVPNSRGDKTPFDAETPESGICLTTSLSFQEEMDDRMMTFDAGSLGSSDVFDDGLLSCGGRFCSCLPPSLSPCSQACCDSDVLSSGSVSSLSQSENLVWETPFFVALDHERRRVVVSIRGTLSVADIVTDLSADTSPISSQDESSPYQGHKGMVEAANYIKRRLIDDMLLHQAFTSDEARGTQNYELLLVGHSLGAGTAAILGIMLRPDYPTLKVYAYSPPGGLLCKESSEYAAEFVTSLVVGKDVVARIGLSQMEFLRADLLNCIKMCRDPKSASFQTLPYPLFLRGSFETWTSSAPYNVPGLMLLREEQKQRRRATAENFPPQNSVCSCQVLRHLKPSSWTSNWGACTSKVVRQLPDDDKDCAKRTFASQRRTRAKYEQNWDKRLRFWFCCTSSGETQDSAFSDIAILFSEFFRDLDVVPTDVLAGLMLLREEQKQRRRAIENSPQNSVFKFLSGVAVTPETKFLDFHKSEDMDLFEELHYYFQVCCCFIWLEGLCDGLRC